MTFDPEQIETELAEIQKRSSPTEARTVILNLLVVSDEESRPRAEQALGAVLGKRAARVIHIVDGQRGESDISLSARCYLDHERKSVCFQEVLIENGSDGVGAAPGSWTPLLIRDIPVYVLWLASFGPRPALLDHVQEQADKLIIDSEYAVAAGDTTGEIFGAVSGVMLPEGFRVSDLTWQRTLPLRRVTAHTFDPEEHARALFDLESVELSGAPPMFAALYLGWIASRLGWQAGEDDGRSSTGGEADSAGGGTRGGAGSPRPGGGRGESSGGGGTPAGSGDNPGGAIVT
ncbi:MAG: glucose-6-phosphate dehydrogenase assembly protein OpcA, partial [Spirochaetia bacterium]